VSHDPGRVLVLGAGPTGLGAAWRLRELGHGDWLVLEAARQPGGLAASLVDAAGFTWDLGGHVQFSHYALYDRVLDAAVPAWSWHDRESWIRLEGRFIPYPIQYNAHRFAAEDGAAILRELERAARAPAPPPRHFGEWLRQGFGETLARKFMIPYNEKIWGHPLEDMDFSWIGERVARPDVERVRRSLASGCDDVSWGPNNRFRFPRVGGTGAIWTGVARGLGEAAIRYGARVVGIDTAARRVRLAGGSSLAFDTLVSSLPLDCLAALLEPEADGLRRAARRLVRSAVHVLGVGLRGGRPEALATKGWIYFPEAHCPYYRVTVFSNYAESHVPPIAGAWSLLAEVCETPHRPVEAEALAGQTLEALRADGLVLPDAEVLSLWHRRLEHGYPTPSLGRDAALAALQPVLEARRVFSRGRFGGWKYEVSNQDHSFMQGVELVDRLVHGTPEVTYADPVRANSGEFLR
jgi:protoporphyrinogen oxidase